MEKFISLKITKTKDSYKVFSHNPKNYYTHIDMTKAKRLNLKIEIIQDGENNFLEYSPEKRIDGKILFKEFINLKNERMWRLHVLQHRVCLLKHGNK